MRCYIVNPTSLACNACPCLDPLTIVNILFLIYTLNAHSRQAHNFDRGLPSFPAAAGFAAEALVVWWGVRGVGWLRLHRMKMKEELTPRDA